MDEPLSSELLAKYLAAEASAEERATVEAWAAANPANAAELEKLRAAWKAKTPGRDWNVDAAWKKVSASLEQTGPALVQSRPKPAVPAPTRRIPWHARTPMRIAAAIVVMAGAALGWQQFGPGSRVPSATFTTKVGERRTVDLADGTRATIGPMSELRVARKYNQKERRVDLTGEVWFEVKHDAERPFRVHALGTVSEDRGTIFSVRAIVPDSIVRVIVAEGAVAVGLERGVTTGAAALNAHDLVELNARTLTAHVVRNVVVEPLMSWRTGHVEFADAPFGDVAVELQRWYGLVVRFERAAIARRPVSYSMPTDNADEALTVLRTSLGVTFERKGDTIFVR